MRLIISNDKFINGTVSFERFERKATLSYITKPGQSLVPVDRIYTIDGTDWMVVEAKKSNFNANVVNVYLDEVVS